MNKRLKDEKDRLKLKDLKEDILNANIDVMKIFEKHGFKIIEGMQDVQSNKNISYFRSRSYKINQLVQEKQIIPKEFICFDHICNCKTYTFKYYTGQTIVCRNTFKRKRAQLYTNYVYEITSVDKKKHEL